MLSKMTKYNFKELSKIIQNFSRALYSVWRIFYVNISDFFFQKSGNFVFCSENNEFLKILNQIDP